MNRRYIIKTLKKAAEYLANKEANRYYGGFYSSCCGAINEFNPSSEATSVLNKCKPKNINQAYWFTDVENDSLMWTDNTQLQRTMFLLLVAEMVKDQVEPTEDDFIRAEF